MLHRLALTACALALAACSGSARSAEAYRDDTAALLETTNEAVRGCYDTVLKTHAGAQGTVAVRFVVGQKTGRIQNVRVDPSGTTAPKPVRDCVIAHIDGLELMPADANDGEASFTWVFKAPPAPPPRPAG